MSRKCTKSTKKVEFVKGDYVVVRPLTHDEMNQARTVLNNSGMMTEFLTEMSKLLDRDPNNEIQEKFEENLKKIKETEDNRFEALKEYNQIMLKHSIVEIFDDNEKQENIEEYLADIDFVTYESIMKAVIELCVPSKEESDFLENGQEKLPE